MRHEHLPSRSKYFVQLSQVRSGFHRNERQHKSTNSWTTTVDIEGFARNIRRTLSHKFASLHFYWINLLFEFWLSRDLSWSSALSIQNRRAVSFLSTDVAKHRQFVRWTLQHKLITVTNCIKQKRERGCKKKLHTYNASPLLIHRGERTSNRVDEFGSLNQRQLFNLAR